MPDMSAANSIPRDSLGSSVRRRRYLLYVVLAAFDLFAVSISLFLNHCMMRIHTTAVQENQAWAQVLRDTSHLGQLASAINAPGNNVFETRRVDDETEKMRAALAAFGEHLGALKERVSGGAAPSTKETLHSDLIAVRTAALSMANEAEQLFSAIRAEQMPEAGSRMARMDRYYDDVNRALFQLRENIDSVQKELFARQSEAAEALRKSEYVIAGLILLMVCGAICYGFQVARQEESDLLERQSAAERKQAMEMRTRVLKQVMDAQEEERRRISRDLHDEIGQCLTSVLVGLRALQSATSVPEARAYADELRQVTARALEEVRRMARGLRPSVLDDMGLTAALERYIDDFGQSHGLTTEFHANGMDAMRLPESIETALYRISQEALTNIAKHAHATTVSVLLEKRAGGVELEIVDDGVGFDCREALTFRGGQGLEGMKERAALLDGAITIESKPGAGTSITVRIPFEEALHGEDASAHRG